MKVSTFNGSEMGPHADVYIFYARYFYLFAFIFLILLFYILVFCLLLRVFETPLFKPRILVPSYHRSLNLTCIQISKSPENLTLVRRNPLRLANFSIFT